tara:strand:- start:88 stop:591 length:504 start_codon:yes stop_codon:yes gene_type:complete
MIFLTILFLMVAGFIFLFFSPILSLVGVLCIWTSGILIIYGCLCDKWGRDWKIPFLPQKKDKYKDIEDFVLQKSLKKVLSSLAIISILNFLKKMCFLCSIGCFIISIFYTNTVYLFVGILCFLLSLIFWATYETFRKSHCANIKIYEKIIEGLGKRIEEEENNVSTK